MNPFTPLATTPKKETFYLEAKLGFKSVVELLFLCKIEKFSEVFVKMIWTKLVISEKSCSFNAQSDFFFHSAMLKIVLGSILLLQV